MAKSQAPAKEPPPPAQPTIVERVEKLVKLANVKKVYFIDDANCKDVDVEVFLGKVRMLHQEGEDVEKLDPLKLEGVDYTDPFEIVSEGIKTKWSDFNPEQRHGYLKKINQANEDQQSIMDYEVTPKIKDYFTGDLLVTVDPFEWESLLGKISESIKDNEKILLIFDQDLKNAGGKFGKVTGVDLIIKVKDSDLKDKSICALLTHEITLTESELYYREQLKDTYNSDIEYADFFPLAKKRLEEPEVFADGIKKTFINKHFEIIKEKTVKLVKDSYDGALEKIRKLDTYDFDDAIIKSSFKEGVWEIETLFRITEIIQKDELQQAMSDTGYEEIVNKEIKQSLSFGEINFKIPDDYKPYSDKVKIRHKEIYQSGDLINKLHKPIENGDIFEMGLEKFILVSQPCDMMVRSRGEKAGYRNAKYVTLLKIETISWSDYEKNVKKPNSMQHYLANKHALLYFQDGLSNVGVVQFADFVTIDVDILDLIVYNESGECIFTSPDNSFNPNYYNTAWELRFSKIKAKIEDFKVRITGSLKNLKKNIADRDVYVEKNFYPRLVVASSTTKEYKAIYNKSNFDFGIKRVLNYKNYNAAFLLDRYSRYLSRTAELHDFAK